MRALLFGLFVGYFLAACAPLHWNSAHLVYGGCLFGVSLFALGWSFAARKSPDFYDIRVAVRGTTLALVGALGAALVLGSAVIRSPLAAVQEFRCTVMVEPVLLRLAVRGLPTHTKHGSRIDAEVLDVAQSGCPGLRGTNLRLSLSGAGRGAGWLSAGQVLVANVRLRRVRSSSSPGVLDYELAAAKRGRFYSGYVIQLLALSDGRSKGWFGLPSFEVIRAVVRHRVLSQQLDHGGMILALATGDSVGLSRSRWRLLQNTGTVHLLIISGLHVGLVASFVLLVIRLILRGWGSLVRLRWTRPRTTALIEAVLTSSVLFGYVQLVGAGVPAVRAWLMVSVGLLLWALERKPQAVLLLLCAFLGVIITHPLSGLEAGFWLSFALVGWLLLGRNQTTFTRDTESQEVSEKEETLYKRLCRIVVVAVGMHVQCCLLLLPLMIWLGLPVAPVGVVANLLAVPLVTLFLVPVIVLSVVLLAVSDSASELGFWIADQLLGVLVLMLEWLADCVPAEVLPALSYLGMLGLFVIVVAALLPSPPFVRLLCWLGLASWLALPTVASPFSRVVAGAVIQSGEFRLSFLDVGQGLAVIIHTAGGGVVYDTGATFPSGFSFAEAVIAPALRVAGVTVLEALVVSHSDNDHAGGAALLMSRFTPKRLAGAVHRNPGAHGEDGDLCVWRASRNTEEARVAIHLEKIWRHEGLEFELLNQASFPNDSSLGNNESCVLIVRGKNAVAVLSGDIEAPAERALTAHLPEGVDVLSVPHHGSRTSSTSAFVERMRPGIAVVSAGYLNRFGHPHQVVIDRYLAIGAKVLSTAQMGTIEWSSADVGDVVGWRKNQLNRWRLGAPMAKMLQRLRSGEQEF